MRRLDPRHVPYLPVEGRLYWARTTIFQPPDKHAERPVVVVRVPGTTLGRISVVSRTSDTSRPGVFHKADPGLTLNLDGVFDRLTSTEGRYWTPFNIRPCGDLSPELFEEIILRWYT